MSKTPEMSIRENELRDISLIFEEKKREYQKVFGSTFFATLKSNTETPAKLKEILSFYGFSSIQFENILEDNHDGRGQEYCLYIQLVSDNNETIFSFRTNRMSEDYDEHPSSIVSGVDMCDSDTLIGETENDIEMSEEDAEEAIMYLKEFYETIYWENINVFDKFVVQ